MSGFYNIKYDRFTSLISFKGVVILKFCYRHVLVICSFKTKDKSIYELDIQI